MQLSFLGQTYEASFPPVAATETPETGIFRGQSYPRKAFTVGAHSPSPARLTYRGVRYIR
jgi:hypothetical protein